MHRKEQLVYLRQFVEQICGEVPGHEFLLLDLITDCLFNFNAAFEMLELVDYLNRLINDFQLGGTGSNGLALSIDQGRITVPARIWKVLVILPEGEDDVRRISTDTRVIAVDTPNNNTLSPDWGTFRTTVDAIEKATGYDLLSNVPEAVQKVIEARIDNGPTQ